MTPYYADASVTVWHGDMREVLPTLGVRPDCVVADPPYAETSLAWDRWPDGWPSVVADVASSMWCFGSMRMFLDRRDEFAAWNLSQDIIWHKNAGTGLHDDRFRRVHEHGLHWYRGPWSTIHHAAIREPYLGRDQSTRRSVGKPSHKGMTTKAWVDDGSRLATSVIGARNMRGKAIHPTEKPLALLDPLVRYACPPGGLVLDPFAGSGSTGEAARLSGRRAVLIEADERYCEAIANRLAQDVLPLGEVAS